MTTLLWVLAVALMVIGVAGVILPALPGPALVFAGILLAAWIDDFTRVGVWPLVFLGALTALTFIIDLVATAVAAQRAGASRLGLIGAAVGTVVGIFAGLIGLIFMPLVGAAIGEFMARRDALRAGRVSLATWAGLLIGAVLKLAIVFAMLGVFIAALLLGQPA